MSVNEDILAKRIIALSQKEEEFRDKITQLRIAKSNLSEIMQVDEVIPIDRRTNKKFASAVRLKIYSDNIALANKLLSV